VCSFQILSASLCNTDAGRSVASIALGLAAAGHRAPLPTLGLEAIGGQPRDEVV